MIINIGISSCLIGENVRYNGEHKRANFLLETLTKALQEESGFELGALSVVYCSVCPEFESGLGVPREPIDLHYINSRFCLIGVNSKTDVTERVARWLDQKILELSNYSLNKQLNAFIFKAKSPSCGWHSACIYHSDRLEKGHGLFARKFVEQFPEVPVATETDLDNVVAIREFTRKIILYQKHLLSKLSPQKL